MPQLYMIGGPNGAGKTTIHKLLLLKALNCHEYTNADNIAAGLSPFSPETTAIQAGRLMLERIHRLANEQKDFAFETTMASKSFASFLKQCKKKNYQINLFYIWLEHPELAIARVSERVKNGGHHIPDDVVLRRYKRSINNFVNIYAPLADQWLLFDNSFETPAIVAGKELNDPVIISDNDRWNKFKGAL